MGGSSKSSSQATSSEVADSYNQISTPTVTASGANSNGLSIGGAINGSPRFTSDSNNQTDSNNSSVNYGADGSAANSGSPAASSGIDWGEVAVWVVGGIALTLVLKFFGDKNV